MRAAAILATLGFFALATTAAAQPLQDRMDAQLRESQLRAQQQMADRQMVIMQNQLNTLEAQVRAERSIADVRAQGYTPRIPPLPERGALPQIDAGQLAAIPDEALAESNARVKAAAENRR